jgi:hypothetical protein
VADLRGAASKQQSAEEVRRARAPTETAGTSMLGAAALLVKGAMI